MKDDSKRPIAKPRFPEAPHHTDPASTGKDDLIANGKWTRLLRRTVAMSAAFALVALIFSGGGQAAAGPHTSSDPRPTIVLVHGDWADASSWNSVIERLQDRGLTVVAPPNTLRGPSQDAPYLAS